MSTRSTACATKKAGLALITVAFLIVAMTAAAQRASKGDTAMSSAMAAAREVAQTGPAEIKMEDQATLQLPADFVFIPSREAEQILAAMGNRAGSDLLGMIFSTAGGSSRTFVVAAYTWSGYIKDEDAKRWNVDDMLDQVRSQTGKANKERQIMGVPAIDVEGWAERPRYDPATHQLQWSISSKVRGSPSGAEGSINYNTYSLGRNGYLSMRFVMEPGAVESQKPVVAQLLAGLRFNQGKRYEDFDAATDRGANYGLASLVGGVAATKPGWYSVAGDFVVKYAKVLALCALALAVIGYYFYQRRPKPEAKA